MLALDDQAGRLVDVTEGQQEIALPVALDGWTLTPSIDYVTLTSLPREVMNGLAKEFDGKLALEGTRQLLTFHDPTVVKLQRIIDAYPNADIFAIEFSVDFRPVGAEPAGLDELAPVFKWLADTLYPTVKGAKRHRFEPEFGEKGRYVKAPPTPCDLLNTHLWRNGLARVVQRLYIKMYDQGQAVDYPSVRLEVTLSMSASSDVALGRVWQLAEFGPRLRKVLMPYFQIAEGIKPKLARLRHKVGTRIGLRAVAANEREASKVQARWRTRGAMWAREKGYSIIPNAEVHKRIGDALHRLGRQISTLKVPEKMRVSDRWIPAESREFLSFDQ